MGSRSDWETMSQATTVLKEFGISYEARVVSAHRTPDLLTAYGHEAEARGIQAIIAGAGGAAHLPGMLASHTLLPVFGVPIRSKALSGMDSLLSIVQMPGGIPVGTLSIGESGARNAALLVIAIFAINDPELRERLRAYRRKMAETVTAEGNLELFQP
jgi:5-(carboxyamino)imidazole ribonucleotide mutase